MPIGKIRKLVTERGYGFIDDDGDGLFFHHTAIQDVAFEELREGQAVEYEVGQGRKGPCATSVRVAVPTS